MKVLVQKVNSGIVFSIQHSSRSSESSAYRGFSGRRTKIPELLRKVVKQYEAEVIAIAEQNNVSTTSFCKAVDNAMYTDKGVIIQFETWGFAFGTFENPEMADTGSVATDGRAKFLLAVQAPLNKTKDEKENVWIWSKEYIV